MPLHTIAFGQAVNPAGAYTQVNAVQDPTINTSGAYAYIPAGVNQLVGAACCISNASAAFARFTSPSLRALLDLNIRPVNSGLVPEDPVKMLNMFDTPLPLAVNEGLEFDVKTTPGASVEHYGVAWLADAALKPTTGAILSTHCTAAASLSANKWVNSNLTFDETLPAGNYQVVGLRCESPNGVAARLVFVGGAWRPGVLCVDDEDALDPWWCRFGGMGVLGQFNNTTPPTIDVLGITDTSQDVWLDLIKVS